MPSHLDLHVIGISHHTAGVELREHFALTPREITAWLEKARDAGLSSLLLSTCNRFELYWCGSETQDASFRDFAQSRDGSDAAPIERWEGAAAVRHLFDVTAGLDSQVLGETEILGQVRRGFDLARAAGTTTRELDLVFSAALAAGRRVRRETLLGRHPASVSSAAVDLMASCCGGELRGRGVVVLGAGEAAEGVLRALHARGATGVSLVNRHPAKAATLAGAWDARPRSWEELLPLTAEADLFIVATSSSRPVVTAAELAAVAARRNGQPLLVMDLAVPRNVEPAARGIPGIRLFDLDDLQLLCCPAANGPADALAEAHRVLDDEISRLEETLQGQRAAPRLAELHRIGVEVAEQETAWAFEQLAQLSDQEREVVREMADRLVRRVLYPVSKSLRRPEQ